MTSPHGQSLRLTQPDKRIIIAMDFPDWALAMALADNLDPARCRLKVGKEMFSRYGPPIVQEFMRKGFEVFLDQKWHDIPNTVAGAAQAAIEVMRKLWAVNMHTAGGRAMMVAARDRVDSMNLESPPMLLGVTVLTSLDESDLGETGCKTDSTELVLERASLAQDCGLDGVVCSPKEVAVVRKECGPDFLTVVPGIRFSDGKNQDQKRAATPGGAIEAGADYLVIGRAITDVNNPMAALERAEQEIAEAA